MDATPTSQLSDGGNAQVDLTRPNVARVYDYYLGGKSNWAVDRNAAKRALEQFPAISEIVRSNRAFLQRAVGYLAGQGVTQFIDVGSGIPDLYSTHATADEVNKRTNVVYVDHDPVTVGYSNALLKLHGDPARHTAINADLRSPEQLLQAVRRTGLIDFDEPIALLFVAVMHVQQPDSDGTDFGDALMETYRRLLPAGSYLAISHLTDDGIPDDYSTKLEHMRAMYETSGSSVIWRTREAIKSLFGDFSLLSPGVTWTPNWRPDAAQVTEPTVRLSNPNESATWAGIGRKATEPPGTGNS